MMPPHKYAAALSQRGARLRGATVPSLAQKMSKSDGRAGTCRLRLFGDFGRFEAVVFSLSRLAGASSSGSNLRR